MQQILPVKMEELLTTVHVTVMLILLVINVRYLSVMETGFWIMANVIAMTNGKAMYVTKVLGVRDTVSSMRMKSVFVIRSGQERVFFV